MPFDVRGTFAVRNDDKALQSAFDRIPASRPRGLLRGKVHGVISQEKLYETYGVAVVRDVVRRFGLADVRFPKVILDQKETAARRRIAIQQEEAEKQVRLVKLPANPVNAAELGRN